MAKHRAAVPVESVAPYVQYAGAAVGARGEVHVAGWIGDQPVLLRFDTESVARLARVFAEAVTEAAA